MLRIAFLLLWLTALASAALAQATEGDDAPLRFGRFERQGQVFHGFLGAGGVHEISGGFFDPKTEQTGRVFPLAEVKILPPIVPGKVIGIAQNYKSHGGEKGGEPKFFAKLPSSLTATDTMIVPPPGSRDLHFEGEMVVVIGQRARDIPVEGALDYVFGVTAGNDVTERSYPFAPFDILRAKGSDTLGPIGPFIVPGLSYDRLSLVTRLNGKEVQRASTKEMLFSVAEIISALSRYMTLEPGDVIFTGTPGTTSALSAGDVVEVDLEGVGVLRNTVAGARPQ